MTCFSSSRWIIVNAFSVCAFPFSCGMSTLSHLGCCDIASCNCALPHPWLFLSTHLTVCLRSLFSVTLTFVVSIGDICVLQPRNQGWRVTVKKHLGQGTVKKRSDPSHVDLPSIRWSLSDPLAPTLWLFHLTLTPLQWSHLPDCLALPRPTTRGWGRWPLGGGQRVGE